MSKIEGSGPGGSGPWKIVERHVHENVQTIARIGLKIDAHITRALRSYGLTEQFMQVTFQREENAPIDMTARGLLVVTGTERLPWLRRAVREKVHAVCGDETPSFEGEIPQGDMPEEFDYVGNLFDAIMRVKEGESKVRFLTTPLQFGPDAKNDERDRDVTILLDAQPPIPDDIPSGPVMASFLTVTKATALGVALQIDTQPSEGKVFYFIVPNRQSS